MPCLIVAPACYTASKNAVGSIDLQLNTELIFPIDRIKYPLFLVLLRRAALGTT